MNALQKDFIEKGYVVFRQQNVLYTEKAHLEALEIEKRINSFKKGNDSYRIDHQNYKPQHISPTNLSEALTFLDNLLSQETKKVLEFDTQKPKVKGWQISSALTGYPADRRGENYKQLNAHMDGAPENFDITVAPFILGLVLTDIPYEDMGNPCVWPKSHLANLEEIEKLNNESENALEGDTLKSAILNTPTTDINDVLQLKAFSGDVIVYHWATTHGIAHNTSEKNHHILYWRPEAGKFKSYEECKNFYSEISDMQ